MPARIFGLAALIFVSGGLNPTQGEDKFEPIKASGAYPAAQTPGNLSAYYGMTPNFANYGLSGTYPGYGGYGYQAYGPGAQFGAHYSTTPGSKAATPSAKPNPKTKPTTRPVVPRTGTSNGATHVRKGL
jgi:hypothetical protein